VNGPGPVSTEFSPTDALVLLLTVETLLFAALSIVLTFNEVQRRVPALPLNLRPRHLGWGAFWVVAIVAFGAVVAWVSLFDSPWPHTFTRWVEAATTLLGIVVQPLASLAFAKGLSSKE